MTNFSSTSLPVAIRKLFELNHYEVQGPVQVHGAEIDLLATPLTDPFANPIYIEATIEYVGNDKYGKDVGKLAMISESIPGARKMIVSAKGFSLPVKERANATRIMTLTYDELFSKFERFEKYISHFLGDTEAARELNNLNDIYEEPDFDDALGKEPALQYLNNWRLSSDQKRWLIITGEYGTGKTALTRIMLRRWLEDYKSNPNLPLPIRIELRDFPRQFDAKGLIHHFLDSNNMGHISIEYFFSLIRDGRAILILDGYDEMAQYLHARERRVCLEALSELTAGGARGILTSRPNYFTEAEELQVFEILYASLKGKYYLSKDMQGIIEREKHIDELLGQFIYRYERTLKDLSPSQTEALIERILKNDPKGKRVVLNVLRRIYRIEEGRDSISLSGKPVIVSYLLEIIENLKNSTESTATEALTEWQVFKLILDQLMVRDMMRTPGILPDKRRHFLRACAMFLSHRENAILDENNFKALISKGFKLELSRLPGESRNQQLEVYFTDLRSSATLTRVKDKDGWLFSHNSLREYLVTEHLLEGLSSENIVMEYVPISDAMRSFAASLSNDMKRKYIDQLRATWRTIGKERGLGQLLTLLWDGLIQLFLVEENPTLSCLSQIAGKPPQLNAMQLSRISFSSGQEPANLEELNCSDSLFSELNFHSANLQSANFYGTTLENVVFTDATLKDVSFRKAFIIDADFSGAKLKGADFSQISSSDISILIEGESPTGRKRVEGSHALGYLNYFGAKTDEVSKIYVIQYHPSFPIVDKIIENLAKSTFRQRRGLEKRGVARKNVPLAERFVSHLEKNGLLKPPGKRFRTELVEVTDRGREVFNTYQKAKEVSDEILSFFETENKL